MVAGTKASVWIFTGSIQNDSSANISMGFAASQSLLTTDGDATSNGNSHMYVIDITGSNAFTPGDGDELIAVMLKNESSTGGAWRFNYRLDGITTE